MDSQKSTHHSLFPAHIKLYRHNRLLQKQLNPVCHKKQLGTLPLVLDSPTLNRSEITFEFFNLRGLSVIVFLGLWLTNQNETFAAYSS